MSAQIDLTRDIIYLSQSWCRGQYIGVFIPLLGFAVFPFPTLSVDKGPDS